MPADFSDPGVGTPAAAWTARLDTLHTEPATLPDVRRLLVVSAHPDDETLGAGGLISTATALGVEARLLCLSDGAGSHPRSPTHTPADLTARRADEYVAAGRALGVPASASTHLDLPDGSLADHPAELAAAVADLIGDERDALLVSTWTADGHPDHEAVGRAAAAAARRTGVGHWQFPVWFWHWAGVDDGRVRAFRPFPLSDRAREAKRHAVAAHASQVTPLSPAPGDETLLDAQFLAYFQRAQEWFLTTSPVPGIWE